jgi:hypothetical protein
MSNNPRNPSRETLTKIAKAIDAGKAHVDSLPPGQRAAEITRLAQQAADRAAGPDATDAALPAEPGG